MDSLISWGILLIIVYIGGFVVTYKLSNRHGKDTKKDYYIKW